MQIVFNTVKLYILFPECVLLGTYPTSCMDVDQGQHSGTFWIDMADGSTGNLVLVWCDMLTDGGGWTLVYSYGFTLPDSFNNSANAVTPLADWTVSEPTHGDVSTDIPITENHSGALSYPLWRAFGETILVKSNLNHWLKCTPRGGSFTMNTAGFMHCIHVHYVGNVCVGVLAPATFRFQACGPSIAFSRLTYYWDGCTHRHYPTHDVCGNNSAGNFPDYVGEPAGWEYELM